MTTARDLTGRPAVISSYLAPILFIGGIAVTGLLWSDYNPVRQTISELAAGDAPTRVLATTLFALTGVCHLVTVAFARGIGIAGRVTFLLGAIASLGVAANPLPSVAGSSSIHNSFAIVGFVLLALWPLLGMRRSRDYPWLVRPGGAVLGTVVLTAFCTWFLVIWLPHTSPDLGLIERVAADAESIWPAIAVTALAVRARRLGARS